MALNTQTQSLALPLPQLFFSSSFLPSAYIQIKYLHLLGRLGCLLVFSAHVICLFKFPVALMSLHVLFSPLFSHISFSFYLPPFFCSFSLQFSPILYVFFVLLSFYSSLSLLWPLRWLVFVSLSLVAAAGSGLNNEITFTVCSEAARSSTQNIITHHCSRKPACGRAHTHRHMHKCVSVHTKLNNKNPDTCREGRLR